MDHTITKLLQTEFLAFTMKAYTYLNKGRTLGTEQYLKLLAKVFASVATGGSSLSYLLSRHGHVVSIWVIEFGSAKRANC